MKEKLFSVETPDESSGFLLWQVTNLWQREIKKALEKYDLTHSQFVLLASTLWFSQFDEDLTQVSLSAHTKIDPMTTSTVLRTLQRKGLIERLDHSTDTRAKVVVLTTEGRRIAKQAVKTVEIFDKAFFQTLGDEIVNFNKKLITLLKKTGQMND